MHIVYLDWFCDPGAPGTSGMSDLVWSLAEQVVAAGHCVTIVAPYAKRPVNADPRVELVSFDTPLIGYRNVIGHALLALRASKLAARISHVDVIHTMEYLSSAVGASLPKSRSWVLTTPGHIDERRRHVNHFDWTTTLAYRAAAAVTARNHTHVIATSESMKRWWLRSGVDVTRLTIIPLGVDTALFHPRRERANTYDMVQNVLFVGRLQSENGLSILLHALALLREEGIGLNLKVVGSGPDLNNGKCIAYEKGLASSIEWIPYVRFDDLPVLYRSADIFVMPRLSHVTPRVLFQAMASGLPVVASEIGGIMDFVKHNVSGLLFDPSDEKSLAREIHRLIQDPMLGARLGINARGVATCRLDWQVVSEQVIRVYEEIACQRG